MGEVIKVLKERIGKGAAWHDVTRGVDGVIFIDGRLATDSKADRAVVAEFIYREGFAQRPDIDTAKKVLGRLFSEAISTAYSSGSVGASISESDETFDYTVQVRITRRKGQ